MRKDYDLVVVGAGPAGLTAGIYGARSGLETVVLEKGICGGLSNEAPEIENYPGFKKVAGLELAERMKEQAAEFAELKELEAVEKIEQVRGEEGKRRKKVRGEEEKRRKKEEMKVVTEKGSYVAKAVIFCTGTRHRKLGAAREDEFLGRGVSYCATCDGFFFRNKQVAVVGGGDSAVREALHLKKLGCEVTLIHRRDKLRAEPFLQKRLKEAGVPVLWNSVVLEIKGDSRVRSVLRFDKERESEEVVEVEGVFVSVGEEPANELALQLGVELNQSGYVVTDKNQRTNLERVYAAGDLTGGVRQVVVACAEGAVAATSAYNDLLGLGGEGGGK